MSSNSIAPDEDSEVRVLGTDGSEVTGQSAWAALEANQDESTPAEDLEKATDTQQAHTEFHAGPPDWYKPPYPPDQLARLLQRSETHSACVQAKSQGVAGHGFDLVPHPSADAEDGEPPGYDAVNDFWNAPESTFQLGPDQQPATPTGVLEHAWDDYESIGWLALEVLSNTQTGEPTGLAHIPAHTIRARKDAPGFVQLDEAFLPVRYFGAAGGRYGDDKTFVDSETGTAASTTGGVETVANELIVIRNYSAIAPHYGIPDVVPALQTIAGDVAARQYNSKFFENDGVPRFAVIVEGGELTDQAWDDLRETFKNMSVEDNAHRGVLLEAVSTTVTEYGEAEDVNIRIEPLTVGVEEDASFVEYREANEHDILQAHDVPGVVVQRTGDVNYSNAREQRVEFAQNTLRPKQETLAARLYAVIHVQGLDVPGWTIGFELHGGENEQREADVAQTRVEASMGSITVNEARDELGYGPMEGAEGEMLLATVMNAQGGGGSGLPGVGDMDVTNAYRSGQRRQRATTSGYSITDRRESATEDTDAEKASDATEKATQYEEGDVVEYDDEGHIGAVVAVMTEDFTVPVGDEDEDDVSASDDSPVYVVARETQGFDTFQASALSGGEIPAHDADVDDMSEAEVEASYADLDSNVDPNSKTGGEVLRILEKDVGWDRYPPSWRNSNIPARVIFLDAWTSMGATFRGCVAEMTGEVATPRDFCASMKDEALGTLRWRNRF